MPNIRLAGPLLSLALLLSGACSGAAATNTTGTEQPIPPEFQQSVQVIKDYWAAFNAFDLDKCVSYLEPTYAETRSAGIQSELKSFEAGRGLGVHMVVADFPAMTTMDDGRQDIRVTMKIRPPNLSPDQHLMYYMVKVDGVWMIAWQTNDPDRNPPYRPRSATPVAVSASQVELTWTDRSSAETGYRVERASDMYFRNDLVKVILPANSTSYTDTTVQAGATYYYQIFAFNKVGDSSSSDRLKVVVPAN